MEPSDKGYFAHEMFKLGMAYQRELSTETLHVYWEHLRDLSADSLGAAVTRAILEERYFPAVATLRRLAGAAPTVPSLTRAEAMWNALRRTYGSRPYDPEALADPITHLVFRQLGGTRYFGTWPYREEPFQRREFINRYDELLTRYRLQSGPSRPEAKDFLERLGLDPGSFTMPEPEENPGA